MQATKYMRRCTKCLALRPLEEFSRRGRGDQRRSACKQCQRDQNQTYYAANSAQLLEQRKPVIREYRRRNPEKVKAWKRADRQRNPESHRARIQKWRDENPERRREHSRQYQSKRRALMAGLPSESIDLQVVWNRDGGRCGICGGAARPSDWHLDHIVPIAAGGPHLYTNVQVAHPRCNLVKGSKTSHASHSAPI